MLATVEDYRELVAKLKGESYAVRRKVQRHLCRTDLFFLLWCICGRLDMGRQWILDRCKEVQEAPNGYLDLWARGHYKMLSIDFPVITPDGFKKHGDLKIGDFVFCPDGHPTRVIAKTPIFYDGEAFEIEFYDGSKIRAGADHVWKIEKHTRKRIKGTFKIDGIGKRIYRESILMTTREISAHVHTPDKRLAIEVTKPLEFGNKPFSIDPYLLGCWLGDGTSVNGDITCGDDIWSEIIKLDSMGKNKTPNRNSELRRIDNLCSRLRSLNLLKNKHIPDEYMRGDVAQRLSLLQGLMDTDGHCDNRGTATFVNINKHLAAGVYQLAASLGMKPHLRDVAGTYKGQSYPYFQVSFQAHKEMPPFRLPRKVAKCIKRPKALRHYIVACRPIPPEPMSCIQVERQDGMYLVGHNLIPTHNSTVITFGKTIQDILIDPEITVGIFAHTRPIAKGFLRQIKREFETNEVLKELFSDILWAELKEAPTWSEDTGIVVKRQGNPKESTVEAWGLVDGQPTSKHFRLRVYDDVVTRESVTTAEQVHKTTEAWELSDNLGVEGGIVRVIGTRYSLFDTYSFILERDAAKARIYPATHNGRMDGVPVLISQKEWELKLKTQSRSTVASQLLQNPLADEDATFRIEWLRPYEVRPRTLNVYIMCDPSKGRNATSDNTAISVVGVAAGGTYYLLDGYCHRMTLSQRWSALRDLYRKWSREPGVVTIKVGYERYGAQSDDEYFMERMLLENKNLKHEEKYEFQIHELNWTFEGTKGEQGKTTRVERLEPKFRNARFFLPLAVWRDSQPMVWHIDDDPESKTYKSIVWEKCEGWTRLQKAAIDGGSLNLVAKAIKRVDEERHVYDVTLKFIEEYSFFPFGRYKDLIDATSRIDDMEPVIPQIISKAATEPNVYFDS